MRSGSSTLDVEIAPFGVMVPDDDDPADLDLEEFDVVEFGVEHDHNGGTVKHSGTVVFHIKHKRRLAGGQ